MSDIILGLDPGHGGIHRGARLQFGPLAVTEREWCMSAAFVAKRVLDGSGWPIKTVLLREGNETVSLDERGSRSAEAGCDFVISLHFDSNPGIHGARTYVRPGDSVAWPVASQILRSVPPPMKWLAGPLIAKITEGREWLQRPLDVMTPHSCPSMLLEAFAGQEKEATYASTAAGIAGVAAAIAAGAATLLK